MSEVVRLYEAFELGAETAAAANTMLARRKPSHVARVYLGAAEENAGEARYWAGRASGLQAELDAIRAV